MIQFQIRIKQTGDKFKFDVDKFKREDATEMENNMMDFVESRTRQAIETLVRTLNGEITTIEEITESTNETSE